MAGGTVRATREGFGDVGVGVVGEVVAAPVVGPGLGVVLDNVVGAPGQGEVGAASNDGGLPGFAAADVSVGGAGAPVGSGGGPVAPAGVGGVLKSSGGVGGGGVRLLVAFEDAEAKLRLDGGGGAEDLRGGGAASAEPGSGDRIVVADGPEGGGASRLDCAERALAGWRGMREGSVVNLLKEMGMQKRGRRPCGEGRGGGGLA